MKYDFATQLMRTIEMRNLSSANPKPQSLIEYIRAATEGLMKPSVMQGSFDEYSIEDSKEGESLTYNDSKKNVLYLRRDLEMHLGLAEMPKSSYMRFEYKDNDGIYCYVALKENDTINAAISFYDAEAVKMLPWKSDPFQSIADRFASIGIVPDKTVKEDVEDLYKKFNELAKNPEAIKELLQQQEDLTR